MTVYNGQDALRRIGATGRFILSLPQTVSLYQRFMSEGFPEALDNLSIWRSW
jgi:hypothetical protein